MWRAVRQALAGAGGPRTGGASQWVLMSGETRGALTAATIAALAELGRVERELTGWRWLPTAAEQQVAAELLGVVAAGRPTLYEIAVGEARADLAELVGPLQAVLDRHLSTREQAAAPDLFDAAGVWAAVTTVVLAVRSAPGEQRVRVLFAYQQLLVLVEAGYPY